MVLSKKHLFVGTVVLLLFVMIMRLAVAQSVPALSVLTNRYDNQRDGLNGQ